MTSNFEESFLKFLRKICDDIPYKEWTFGKINSFKVSHTMNQNGLLVWHCSNPVQMQLQTGKTSSLHVYTQGSCFCANVVTH